MRSKRQNRQTSESGSRFSVGEVRSKILSLPTLLAIAIGIAIIVFLLWRVLDFEWDEFASNLTGLNIAYYLLAAVMYYASFWIRGLRWRSLFITVQERTETIDTSDKTQTPTRLTMTGLILSGWFVNSVMFFRLGDAYRSWALAQRSNIGISAGLGTVFAERVQDMALVLVLVTLSALWLLLFDGLEASGAIVNAIVIVIAVAAGLALVLLLIIWVMMKMGERVSSKLPSRIRNSYLRFQSGTLGSFSRRQLPSQIALGLIAWLLEIARFYLVAQAMGLEMAFSIAMFAALAHSILTTVPIPGGLGIVETGLIGLLILVGMNDTDAFTLTVLDRAISWMSVIVIGGAVFIVLSVNRTKRNSAPKPTSPTSVDTTAT